MLRVIQYYLMLGNKGLYYKLYLINCSHSNRLLYKLSKKIVLRIVVWYHLQLKIKTSNNHWIVIFIRQVKAKIQQTLITRFSPQTTTFIKLNKLSKMSNLKQCASTKIRLKSNKSIGTASYHRTRRVMNIRMMLMKWLVMKRMERKFRMRLRKWKISHKVNIRWRTLNLLNSNLQLPPRPKTNPLNPNNQ
jgi:hypothetical protein